MGFLDSNGLGVLWKNIVGKSIPYGYCTTGASTRAKTVTVSPAITELTAGVQILVKFEYANTASTTSSPVTLNVNGLGAKDIKRYGSTNISNSATTSWNANSVVLLTYDGTYWQLTDYNNTTYSSMSVAEYEAGTSGTARLITPARLKGAIQHWATGEANVQSDWDQTDDTADDYIKNKPTLFSGDYGDLTSKPIYFGTCPTADTETVKIVTLNDADDFSLEAGAKIAVSFVYPHNPNVSTPKLNVNNTGVKDIVFPESGSSSISVAELCGWSQFETVYFQYSGSKWLMFTSSNAMSILFQRDELRADWEETDANSLSYINNKPNVPVRVYGTTQTITPTEVKDALNNGNIVEIVHEDQTFSFLTFFSFNYSWAFGMLISNTLVDYQGSTYLYTLVGNINNDSWSGSATPMAKLSDIPTIPTNVSSFANDAGYLTSYTETDPTVPAWAKASSKPSYGAEEVGLSPASVSDAAYIGGSATVEDALLALDDATAAATAVAESALRTETDPTVPAWAKASTKPSYGADEISFSVPQAYEVGDATDVEAAIVDLDVAVTDAKSSASSAYQLASNALPKAGGQLTGDLTLKSDAATNSKSVIFQRGTLTDNYNDWQIQDRGGFLYFDQRGTGSSSFSNQVCFNTSGNVQASTFNGYSLAGASAKSVDTSISSGTTSTNLPTSQAVASYVEGMFGAGFGADEIDFGGGQYYIQDLNDDTNLEQVVGTIDTYIGQSIVPNILPTVSASDNGKVLRVVNGAWSAVALPSASGVSF